MNEEDFLRSYNAYNANTPPLDEQKNSGSLQRMIQVAEYNRALTDEEIKERYAREWARYFEWLNEIKLS